MNQEQFPIFNLSKKKLSLEEGDAIRSSAREALRKETEIMKAELREICVPMSENLRRIENELDDYHAERCKAYGKNAPEKPEVFLVPAEYRDKLGKPKNIDGFVNSFDNTVVVFVNPNESEMWVAKNMAHELEHAYAYHQVASTVNPEAPDDRDKLVVGIYRKGCKTISPKGEYGTFLEEGVAELGAIRFFKERLSQLYPDDYETYLSERARIIGKRGLTSEVEDFVCPSYDKETDVRELGLTNYMFPTKMVQLLADALPNGETLLNKAHIRGNYVPLAREFELRYGKGTFRIAMSLAINEESAMGFVGLLRAQNAEDGNAIIERLLADRPLDLEALRRHGVL